MMVMGLALALAARAADDKPSPTERPVPVTQDRSQPPPSKEGKKPASKKSQSPAKQTGEGQKPAKAGAAVEQNPSAKPCEEVKPCAIE
jgi:hypothetical protein